MAYLLKARTVESKKQSLLANGSERTFLFRQRLNKYVPAPTGTKARIEVLLETVFSARSVKVVYKEDNLGNRVNSLREAVRILCWSCKSG
jgi:hypothetical protein